MAVWDNIQTREHNRLSVAPRLTISSSVENTTRRLRIRNDGIGPAIIDRMTVRMRTQDGEIESESWMDVRPTFTDEGHSVSSMWEFSQGDAIGVDKAYILFGVDPSSASEASDLLTMFLDLSIRVEYASIYGDPFEVTYNWAPSEAE